MPTIFRSLTKLIREADRALPGSLPSGVLKSHCEHRTLGAALGWRGWEGMVEGPQDVSWATVGGMGVWVNRACHSTLPPR